MGCFGTFYFFFSIEKQLKRKIWRSSFVWWFQSRSWHFSFVCFVSKFLYFDCNQMLKKRFLESILVKLKKSWKLGVNELLLIIYRKFNFKKLLYAQNSCRDARGCVFELFLEKKIIFHGNKLKMSHFWPLNRREMASSGFIIGIISLTVQIFK